MKSGMWFRWRQKLSKSCDANEEKEEEEVKCIIISWRDDYLLSGQKKKKESRGLDHPDIDQNDISIYNMFINMFCVFSLM